MNLFLWNIFLAAVWATARGDLGPASLAVGFLLGYVALWLCRGIIDSSAYCRRLPKLAVLMGYFTWELLRANLRVARDVLTPGYFMRPGIIAVPLDAKTDLEILLLAGMTTLTPGTLALGISADRRTMYVHNMYIGDVEEEKRHIKQGFERRLLEVTR